MKKLILSTLLALSAFTLQAEPFQIDFSGPTIVVNNPEEISVQVSVGRGVYYNGDHEHSWIMRDKGMSFIDVSFTNNSPEGELVMLDLFHLSSTLRPLNQLSYSPITISLNGQEIIKGFSPVHSVYYCNDSFDMTPFVKRGKNKLRISLDDAAYSDYWLQKLEVKFL